MTEKVKCPRCQRVPDEFGLGFGAEPERAPCTLCNGEGLVEPEVVERVRRGQALREARKGRGETVWQAAYRLGISAQEVSKRELGEI